MAGKLVVQAQRKLDVTQGMGMLSPLPAQRQYYPACFLRKDVVHYGCLHGAVPM